MNPRLAARSIVALGFAASTACIGLDFDGPAIDGSGRIASETRTVQEFDRITIGGAFDVEVTVGPAVSVTLTGDDNLLPLVGTEVRGATLHVEPERDLDPTDDIHVRITTPRLRGLSTSGSSEVRATGIRSPAFEAQVSGSSELARRRLRRHRRLDLGIGRDSHARNGRPDRGLGLGVGRARPGRGGRADGGRPRVGER
jgi:hypothetical protein